MGGDNFFVVRVNEVLCGVGATGGSPDSSAES